MYGSSRTHPAAHRGPERGPQQPERYASARDAAQDPVPLGAVKLGSASGRSLTWRVALVACCSLLLATACSGSSPGPVEPAAVREAPPSGLAQPQPEPDVLTYPLAEEFSGFSEMGNQGRARTITVDQLIEQVCRDGKSACIDIGTPDSMWAVSRHGLSRQAGKQGAIVWCPTSGGIRSMWSTEFRFQSTESDEPSFPDRVNIWRLGEGETQAVLVDQVWDTSPDGPDTHVVDVVAKPAETSCARVFHVSSGPGTTVRTDGKTVEVTFRRSGATRGEDTAGRVEETTSSQSEQGSTTSHSQVNQPPGPLQKYCVSQREDTWLVSVSEQPDFNCELQSLVEPVPTFSQDANPDNTTSTSEKATTTDRVTSDDASKRHSAHEATRPDDSTATSTSSTPAAASDAGL